MNSKLSDISQHQSEKRNSTANQVVHIDTLSGPDKGTARDNRRVNIGIDLNGNVRQFHQLGIAPQPYRRLWMCPLLSDKREPQSGFFRMSAYE
ncbi:hypothetical protein AVEN_227133-1 [Araneus ventricosus]|uniref:Uncharacterized protein n=1 Tax=Araneus ventricosus TaxID=182803 RepID=A0A4Y2BXL8_ARAVE|nr:hypothetical protein AVEN_227133-1 [Araneus ventricosus]